MEIRNSLLPPPLTQPLQGPQASTGLRPAAAAAPAQADAGNGGLTEYVSQGELLQRQGGDYGDLLRTARQQRAQAATSQEFPGGGGNPYAVRALSAYQSNSAPSTPAATHIDETA